MNSCVMMMYRRVYGGEAEAPGGVRVALSQHGQLAARSGQQDPVAAAGVQHRRAVQVIVLMTQTGHQREQELHLLRCTDTHTHTGSGVSVNVCVSVLMCVCAAAPADVNER